jgi:hypothetical protein
MEDRQKGDRMAENTPSPSVWLPDELLARLITELDDETVTALVLRGSYARGNAIPPYSDVDLVRITQEMPDRAQQKRYLWRDGYLISISTRTIATYRQRLATPERAIFDVAGVRTARILLDKDGAYRTLQQEVMTFQWEPLQADANAYASQLMAEQTEVVLPTLKAFLLQDALMLSDMILDLFSALTEAVAVQRGVLVSQGSTYFHEVQEAVGLDSAWTYYHRCAAGVDPDTSPSIQNRGIAVLHLYQETVRLLYPYLHPEHLEAIGPVASMIDQALSHRKFT